LTALENFSSFDFAMPQSRSMDTLNKLSGRRERDRQTQRDI